MLTKKISNWMIAAAIILGVAALTPDSAEAQTCATCDNATGICDGSVADPDDRCYQGIDWDEGKLFCASWGSILDCDDPFLSSVSPDGSLLVETRFAMADEGLGEVAIRSRESGYVRDCRSRIVVRSYTDAEAVDMRSRTELIEI